MTHDDVLLIREAIGMLGVVISLNGLAIVLAISAKYFK